MQSWLPRVITKWCSSMKYLPKIWTPSPHIKSDPKWKLKHVKTGQNDPPQYPGTHQYRKQLPSNPAKPPDIPALLAGVRPSHDGLRHHHPPEAGGGPAASAEREGDIRPGRGADPG